MSAVALLAALAAAVSVPSAPRRVVSLSPCLDAILLGVADPGQIAALSHYSREEGESPFAARARRYPFTWGSAEEVIAARPDLVLTTGTGPVDLAGALPRLGVRQATFTVPASVDESLAQVERVAQLMGHPDRGAALTAAIRVQLRAAAPRAGEPRLRALIYESQGFASGPGTLVDELMRRTGFDNLAMSYGLARSGAVPLEALVAKPPQVLLAGRLRADQPVWADRLLSHPVLRMLGARLRRESFPQALIYCGGPTIGLAAQALARARENALAGVSR